MMAPAFRHQASRQQSVARIFLAPAIMASIVACGLLSALLGDGIWDALSWVALLAPVAAIAYFARREKTRLNPLR
jgi:hypothetical protein